MTTTPSLSVAALTIDSADPAALADFWGKALGRPVSPGAVAGDMAVDTTDPASGPRLIFHPVPAPDIEKLLTKLGVEGRRAKLLAELSSGRPGWAVRRAKDESVIELHHAWTRRLEEIFGAPADVPLHVAAQLDAEQMGWRRSEGDEEDPAVFAIASWQIELRRRMLASRGREQGRWARLLELSYDTLGYLEQNVSPRLALETFLLECRKAS